MKTRLLLVFFLALSCVTFGQKIKLVSGKVTPLKGEKMLNLQYVYDGLMVGKDQEADYIKEKVSDYNAKEPGKGDKWKEAWSSDRKSRYQPKFEELFSKYMGEVGISTKEGASEAKYTVVIKTTMIEPGFNVGVMRRPAFINVTVDIVEAANPGNTVAEITFEKVPGADVMGYDFDSGWRISEAYAKLGKSLAKYLIKNAKL